METVVASVYNSWRDVAFGDLQKTLESVACELTSNHEKNDISRTNLVNQTKEFRKSASEDVRKYCSTVIKCYQSEFDALQKRCRYAEEAYLSMYKQLIELPDPSFALGELHSLQKRADKAVEFEFESRKFKESCDELKTKVQELKNYERENKRLKKRLDELTVSLETQIQLNSSKIVDEYQRKLESKEQEFAIFKAEAEEKLGSFESKNIAISKGLPNLSYSWMILKNRMQNLLLLKQSWLNYVRIMQIFQSYPSQILADFNVALKSLNLNCPVVLSKSRHYSTSWNHSNLQSHPTKRT
uniref:Casp, putative n=1 Tax=Schistosoma mansoni TaxID=6183 RepID=A0A5K4EED9_SCHMA